MTMLLNSGSTPPRRTAKRNVLPGVGSRSAAMAASVMSGIRSGVPEPEDDVAAEHEVASNEARRDVTGAESGTVSRPQGERVVACGDFNITFDDRDVSPTVCASTCTARRLPPLPRTGRPLHVVGLPRARLPAQPGPAHRPHAHDAERARDMPRRGHRSRRAQGQDAERPRAGRGDHAAVRLLRADRRPTPCWCHRPLRSRSTACCRPESGSGPPGGRACGTRSPSRT